MRWSRLRGIRSALPSRYVRSSPASKQIEAAVLEEPSEHRADADRLAQARHARNERADRAHDDVDLDAGLRGAVELLDHLGVREVVALQADSRVLAGLCGVTDLADQLDQALLQVERGDEQLAEALRTPEPGDEVEEVGDVGGDLGVGGEEPDVLVRARGCGVVVAGSDVDVAAQVVFLAAHDQGRLRVDLHVGEPVDDVDARLLERARPFDVAALVEARLELDDADALLAVLGRLDESVGEHRVLRSSGRRWS